MNQKIVDRRTVLSIASLVAGGMLLDAGPAYARPGSAEPASRLPSPDEAWARMRTGNRRWVSDTAIHPHQDRARRVEAARKQEPYAVVVSCIDSRVAPELVFDTGVGDLLSVRSAAQTIDPLVSGAIEYGPAELDTPLIVVLGHQRCGAVAAAAHALHEGTTLPGNLQDIVEALRPAYRRAHGNVDKMIRINTADVVSKLKSDKLLAKRIARKQLKIVGGYYSLDTGQVTRVV
ncbi:carbonic anhydrase [Nonomuraea sp. NPDC049714]|uniref:carbonic anhydrase n=1 Tax=Nonomuraea sp. NPDC049714 TaxID=3364357 RepID=UPI0037B38011